MRFLIKDGFLELNEASSSIVVLIKEDEKADSNCYSLVTSQLVTGM